MKKKNPTITDKGKKQQLNKSQVRKYCAKRRAMFLRNIGWSFEETVAQIMEEYGYAQSSAENLTAECATDMKAQYEKYVKDCRQRNMGRLNAIINKALEDNRPYDALKAIDIQNKMAGCYTTKVEVKDADFHIKFD